MRVLIYIHVRMYVYIIPLPGSRHGDRDQASRLGTSTIQSLEHLASNTPAIDTIRKQVG